jgi:hypothetical protein
VGEGGERMRSKGEGGGSGMEGEEGRMEIGEHGVERREEEDGVAEWDGWKEMWGGWMDGWMEEERKRMER